MNIMYFYLIFSWILQISNTYARNTVIFSFTNTKIIFLTTLSLMSITFLGAFVVKKKGSFCLTLCLHEVSVSQSTLNYFLSSSIKESI